ncbi:MAG: HAD-IA family hydrolase [Neomegalonema sp.]|nr:HAD-IA family hydrolase [Neomegalonema sp.]
MADRVAVFDLDGTLADTSPDLVGALNAVLTAEGLPAAPIEAVRKMAGLGGRALLRRGFELAGRPLDRAGIEDRVDDFIAAYEARLSAETAFFPGLEPALDALSAAGWTLSVCTNKPERLALQLLAELGALQRFETLLGGDSLPVKKPDPRHLTETVARSGGSNARAVMIGDTETDLAAARNAEIPVVLVQFGFWDRPVAELGPDAEIGHYQELPAVLERLLPP